MQKQFLSSKPKLKTACRRPCCLQALFLLLGLTALPAQQNPPLTNAADVISLSAERAWQHLEVHLNGIVTAADPALKGRFFVQDITSGVFIDNAGGQHFCPGDVVEISGISDAGAFAPVVTQPQVRKIGEAPLPQAKPVSLERLMSGAEDSQRIEVSGTARAAHVDGSRLSIDLVSGGYRFRAYAKAFADLDPRTLVASLLRVRGTAAEAHNRSLRQLVTVEVYIPVRQDLLVEKRESANPFELPASPLNTLAQYRPDRSFNQRVHVRATVTLQRLGEKLFLNDPGGGLEVQTHQLTPCVPGEVVDVVGFPNFENFLPVLQDAVFQKTAGHPAPIAAKPASFDELQHGLHHADFVQLRGKLIDRTIRRAHVHGTNAPLYITTLVLQDNDAVFTAEATETSRTSLAAIPLGSHLSVSGICLSEIDSDGTMKSFRLLIGSPRDVGILQKPSWLTPRNLLIGLAGLALALVIIASWTVMVSKRNSALNFLIREREKAQLELQQAHDQLEERVKQRSAELKFQITARKDSELQFKAVLAERTRLAQELHDTVEQTLTGIALQLDTAAKLYDRSPDGTRRHLELARNLMANSQLEVRRSVWDLRCRALEQFDLPGALLRSARQITDGTSIQVELETIGQQRSLPEVVEENLLRVGQEALTNVIKHSRATLVKMQLEFQAQQVILQIKDNGAGLPPNNNHAGPGEGHFGLLGMSERAKRLGGRLDITSAAGSGTTVRIEIPLDATNESAAPEPANTLLSDEELRKVAHPDR